MIIFQIIGKKINSTMADWITYGIGVALAHIVPTSSWPSVCFGKGPVRETQVAKSCNGSTPNPPIYSFDGTQVAR